MKGSKLFPLVGLGLVLCALLMSACSGKIPANGAPALNITAANPLPMGAEGDAYLEALPATGGVLPYTWTIDSGALPPGLTLSAGGVLSGTPPTGSAGTYNFTVRVTDSQTPVKAYQVASLSLTINPPLSLQPVTLQNAVVGVPYAVTLMATGGIPLTQLPCSTTLSPPFYNYALASGSGPLPAGLTLNCDGTITGTPTGSIGPFPIIVQVTDGHPTTATANFTITVTGKIQGNYAISFNGYNNGQPFYMAGSFCADGNGVINPANEPSVCPTDGVLDRNGTDSIGTLTNVSFTGTYTIDNTTNLGTMTLTIPGLGTYNYNLAVSVVAETRFIEIDPNIYGSGVIRSTTSITLPAGNSNCGGYAFGFFGNDAGGKRLAGAGTFTPGASGNLTGLEDTNDNGIPSGATSITGTFTPPSGSSPRGTITLNAGLNTIDYAFYVVVPANGPVQLLAVQTDPVSSGVTLASMQMQSSAGATCTFGPRALSGVAVTELNAVSNVGATPDISLGLANFDGNGNITSYTFDENNGGILTTPAQNSYKGTYTVDATTGRVLAVLAPLPDQVWYLVNASQGANSAFVVGTDQSVTAGSFEPQASLSFADISLVGKFYGGTITPVLATVTNEADSALAVPGGQGQASTFTVTFDTNGPNGPGTPNQTLSATYSVDSTGRAVICDSSGATNFKCNGTQLDVLYIVSTGVAAGSSPNARNVSLNTDTSPPRLSILVGSGR